MAGTLRDVDEFESAASSAFAPLRIRPASARPFAGSVHATRVGDVTLTRISSTPITVRREPDLIGSGDPELVKVAWHGKGRAGVAQDDRRCVVTPGQMVAYDTTRPYELSFWEPTELVVAAVPRTMLQPHTNLFRTRTARAVTADDNLHRLLSSFFGELAGSLEGMATTGGLARHYLAEALVTLVVATFTDTGADRATEQPGLFERIQAYCLANLSDPELDVRSIADAHHISVRYLHKLSNNAGIGLSTWIRHERLSRVRAELADPAQAHRTPASIAAGWGLLDGNHLSRAMRAEFGVTPTEIRKQEQRA